MPDLLSYVGVTGLVRRMSLNQCLPQFLLRESVVQKIEDINSRKVGRITWFIGTPADRFPHRITDLDGVRLIL
jgi:hypothetical protein